MLQRVKCNDTAHTVYSRSGHLGGYFRGSAKFFSARDQIERVDVEMIATINDVLCFCDHVNCAATCIDHRCAGDTNLRRDVSAVRSYIGTGYGSAKIDMPQWQGRSGVIGVEGINSIVLRGDVNHISDLTSNRKIRNVERLSIDLTVYGARKQLSKGIYVHIGGVEHGFGQVLSCPTTVVVVGGHRDLAVGNSRRSAYHQPTRQDQPLCHAIQSEFPF